MFQDVDQQSTLGKAVDYVNERGLLFSYADGTFRPDNMVSLAEAYKIFYYLFPKKERLSSCVGKVEGEHWGMPYVRYFQQEGYIKEGTISEGQLKQPISYRMLHDILEGINPKRELCEIPVFGNFNKEVTRGKLALILYDWAEGNSEYVVKKINAPLSEGEYEKALDTMKEYRFWKGFFPTDLRYAYEFLLQDTVEEVQEEEALCFACMMEIMDIKHEKLQRVSGDKELAHYTSLRALESLTRPGARFRLSPVAYLNDPQEGCLGLEKAKEKFKLKQYGALFDESWDREKDKGVFIGSFVLAAEKESLPMWVHYGNQAEGCIIKVKASDLGEEVYEVEYKESTQFDEFIDGVIERLDRYREEIGTQKNIRKDPVFLFAKSVVEQVSFLVKDEHYTYEKEVRVLQTKKFTHAKEGQTIREGETFPRIYSELPGDLKITGVTLGKKVKNPERVEATLKHRGLDANHMEQSEIEYR